MSGFYGNTVRRKARKDHRCSYCGEQIHSGEYYEFQSGVWEGRWFNSHMHPECFEEMCESGEGEYDLYVNERPKNEGA